MPGEAIKLYLLHNGKFLYTSIYMYTLPSFIVWQVNVYMYFLLFRLLSSYISDILQQHNIIFPLHYCQQNTSKAELKQTLAASGTNFSLSILPRFNFLSFCCKCSVCMLAIGNKNTKAVNFQLNE